MNAEVGEGIARLELALGILREQKDADWEAAAERALELGGDDADALKALIIVATHGAPSQLSYMDQDWMDFLDGDPD